MRKNWHEVEAWEKNQVQHGTKDWRGLCQSAARSAWGLPAWSPSAKLAWEKVPVKYRKETNYKEVPAGALIYDPLLSKWGHAWVSAGHGMAYSTDYKRRGHIDLVPAHLPAWRHNNPKVRWTLWTPHGILPVE